MAEPIHPVPEGFNARIRPLELAELHDLANADPDRFWLDQARRLTWNKFPTKAGDWSFHEGDFHIRWFADGNAVTISDEQSFADYEAEILRVPGLKELVAREGKTREERALAAEMVLEGLHQHLKLARADLDSQISYKEMVKFQLLKPRRTPGGGRDRGDVN